MLRGRLVAWVGLSQVSGVDGLLEIRACRKLLVLTAGRAWRSTLPSVVGGTDDPECDCRAAEAPLQGRL